MGDEEEIREAANTWVMLATALALLVLVICVALLVSWIAADKSIAGAQAAAGRSPENTQWLK